jgi:hypothetical protein
MSGIEISDYRIDSSFYRLSEGNLKGAFIWNRNGKNHQTEYDIPFIAENGLWKIDILPIIRF